MKISFFEIKDWEKKYLTENLKGHKLYFFDFPLTAETAKKIKSSDIISVSIYSKIGNSVLDKISKVKLITTRSTGFDHIDLISCKERGIKVSNVPFYGENTVAEHTFALILSISRNIHKAYVKALKNDFSMEGLKGFDLEGKTIGVVGAGRIGLHVIRIAKGLGMNILACDTSQDNFLAEVLRFKYVSFEELLKSSDIISLHVPHNKYTHHLINKESIKKIKKGAILINTARGEVVETEALIEALDKKILSGAGLDVLEGEEIIKEEKRLLKREDEGESLIKSHVLLEKENVVFTPHIGFYSDEALKRTIETTVKNIDSFSKNKPINIVNI